MYQYHDIPINSSIFPIVLGYSPMLGGWIPIFDAEIPLSWLVGEKVISR